VNAKDWNGHVPDEPREDVASDSRESHEILLSPPADPALRCAWYEGYLAAVGIVAARAQAQLDAVLERRAA
jgi:hypothetical protein